MCDKCSSKGEWHILEKFLSLRKLTKSNNIEKELEKLRNTIRTQEDYGSKWNDVIKSNQYVADLSSDLYENVLDTFSLPVRYNELNIKISIYYIYKSLSHTCIYIFIESLATRYFTVERCI